MVVVVVVVFLFFLLMFVGLYSTRRALSRQGGQMTGHAYNDSKRKIHRGKQKDGRQQQDRGEHSEMLEQMRELLNRKVVNLF